MTAWDFVSDVEDAFGRLTTHQGPDFTWSDRVYDPRVKRAVYAGIVLDVSGSMDTPMPTAGVIPRDGRGITRYDFAVDLIVSLVSRRIGELAFTTVAAFADTAAELLSPGLDFVTSGGATLFRDDTEVRGDRYVFKETGEPTQAVQLDLNKNPWWRNRQMGNTVPFEDNLDPDLPGVSVFRGFGDFVEHRIRTRRKDLGFTTNAAAGFQAALPLLGYFANTDGDTIINTVFEGEREATPLRLIPVPIVVTDDILHGHPHPFHRQLPWLLPCGEKAHLLVPGVGIFVGNRSRNASGFKPFWSCTVANDSEAEAAVAQCQDIVQRICDSLTRVLTLKNSGTSILKVGLRGELPGLPAIAWDVYVAPGHVLHVPWTTSGGPFSAEPLDCENSHASSELLASVGSVKASASRVSKYARRFGRK